MSDPFAYLLKELGTVLHLSLHVDQLGACSILLPRDFLIHLEPDSAKERLFLFAKLAPLPPGRFREEVLKEGLKANGAKDPLAGILAYLDKTNQLILYQQYPLAILNGERLAGLFASFRELGMRWRTAILQGQIAPPLQEV